MHFTLVKTLALTAIIACGGPGNLRAAQPSPGRKDGSTTSGFQPRLHQVPQTRPKSAMEVDSFLTRQADNDAQLEVVVGQGRLLTLKQDIAIAGRPSPLIAVGDPTILDFEVLPQPRLIRLTGQRAGVTDLSVTTSLGQTYSFEVHVVYDLPLLRVKLRQMFPDASLNLGQIREHLVVEGEARSTRQVASILQTIRAYLESVQVTRRVTGQQTGAGPAGRRGARPTGQAPRPRPARPNQIPEEEAPLGMAYPEGARPSTQAQFPAPQIINLIRVPGPHQVLLKVQVAELNRKALREIGADWLFSRSGRILGTNIGGAATVSGGSVAGGAGIVGLIEALLSEDATAFGIFQNSDFQLFLNALRQNGVVKILAEPNLVALNGHQAYFLSGGEFPVPIPQTTTGGAGTSVTVEFQEFGISLSFLPHILDDETIRLSVDPEVSTVDFSLGTTLVPGGDPVPGLNTRTAHTTVELREGQTLMIAGLLSSTMDNRTDRIPGLGDLPYIGPLFSSTSVQQEERELIILVTPNLIEAMNPDEVPPLPGKEVYEPNDLEVYLLGRIEGRTGRDFRSTTNWDDPLHLVELLKLEKRYISGPHGYSE